MKIGIGDVTSENIDAQFCSDFLKDQFRKIIARAETAEKRCSELDGRVEALREIKLEFEAKTQAQRAVIEAAGEMNDITEGLKAAIKKYQDNGLKCCASCETTAQKNECVVAFQHGYLASVARAEASGSRAKELEAVIAEKDEIAKAGYYESHDDYADVVFNKILDVTPASLTAKRETQRAVIEAAIMWADADPLRNPEVIEALDTAVAKYKGTI